MNTPSDEIIDIDWEQQSFKPWGMELNTYCMFMHLSQLASSIIPMAGIILPIVMWQQFKHQNELINQQGKNIMNFMLSIVVSWVGVVLLFLLFFVLLFVGAQQESAASIIWSFGIMFILIIVLSVSSLVYFIYVIIAALKANRGELGNYPFTIRFFK
ncbi:MAG: hypothetical protein RL365_9 [Bacteroidota bacterium]|jgi:uncharacterized Tic20 family protein